MRHKTILLLTFVLALAAATALIAQDNTATTTGKVTNVDRSAGTISVSTTAGSSETFTTDSQSMYMSEGRTITLSTLKTGDQVTITYRDNNGVKTITHVDVVPSGSTTTGDAYNQKTPTDTYNSNPGGTTYTPPADTRTDRRTTAYHDDDSMNTRTDDHLPKTASPLPLIGLAAALFGGAALGLAGARRLAS